MLPIIAIYRKYYGWSFALRITALMFITIAIAALTVDGIFGLAGLIPSERPSQSEVFGSVDLDYKAALNAIGFVVFAILFWLTVQRGVTDPICGMKVDRAKAKTLIDGGGPVYFCSDQCAHEYKLRTTSV